MRTAKALDVPKSIASRFWLSVNVTGPVHPTLRTRCQLWTGHLNPRGYGVVGIGQRTELAHRVAAVLRDGPLKAGELVLHVFGCSSRACVLHTYRGNQKQNMRDRAATGYKPGRNPAKGAGHWTKRIGMPRNAKGQNLSRAEATKLIRLLVFSRSNGRCECGCLRPLGDSGHLDHMWGRAKAPQSIENCWALALQCDDDKTNNRPSAITWAARFRDHAERHGYAEQVARADLRIEKMRQKGFT